MKKCTVILLWSLVVAQNLYGQDKGTGWIRGELLVESGNSGGIVMISGNAQMSVYMSDPSRTSGAVVMLMTATDTLYTIVADGTFLIENVPLGKAKITVSHLSYETVTQEVEIQKRTRVTIHMKEKAIALPEMVVKGEAPLITMHGDTMKFNAAAVALMDGDVALEILKQVPGVEISESGITVLGKDVKRTYVNRRMIFGRDEMAALVNLPASEVVSINTYEEYENPDSSRRHAGEEKVRVLDIKTKYPIVSATTGHALASAGHDFDPAGRTRYGIGATGNFFSEAFLFSVNAFTNNVNRTSNRASDLISVRSRSPGYERKDYAGVNAEKVWGDASGASDFIRVVGDYSYNRTYSLSENQLRDVYLPSASYTSRVYADTTSNSRTAAAHKISLNIAGKRANIGSLDLGTSLRLSDEDGDYSRRSESLLDRSLIGSRSLNRTRQQGYTFTQKMDIGKSLGKLRFDISANYERSDHDGSAWREDSLASTGLRKVMETGPVGVGDKLAVQGSTSIGLTEKPMYQGGMALSFNYGFDYEHSRRQRFASDISNLSSPLTDTVNTYDFTNNFNRHRVQVKWNYVHERIGSLEIGLAGQSSSFNRGERFPDANDFRRYQHALLPSLHFGRHSVDFRFDIQYQASTMLPSMEQWRSQLDNRNPYQLIAGNPDLKQSYTHDIMFSTGTTNKKGNALEFLTAFTLTENMIAAKTTYFTADTPLPEWHTVAPAQGNLTEYVNLSGRATGRVVINYGRTVNAIKSRVTTSVLFDYDAEPSYIQGQLAKMYSYAPALRLSLRSNFSRQFRIEANTTGRYTYSENTLGQESRVLNITGGATTQWNITKTFFLNTAYNLSFYKSYTGLFDNTTTHILNAVAGCKLLKGNVELSVAAYDVLNRNTGFRTTMTQDYIRNTWTQSFGRYFTFNIAYKFFKSKSGLKSPSGIRLQDGGVKEAVGGGSMQVQ